MNLSAHNICTCILIVDEELEELKQEFWHQQMKIDEFNILRDDLDSFAGNVRRRLSLKT